ncbi:MAG TPA: NAD(P)-binding protein [Gaiellaceae bacterium]|nr:NAD(P)-binding protein [Gaiellaceae bacterium]
MARDPRFDILFEPVRIGPKVLRNRFYQVPHCTGFGTDKPGAQARFRATKAEGGWAAICTELCSIHPETDRAPRPVVRLWDDDDVRNLALTCEEAHEHGALAGIELWHGGPTSEGSASREIPGAPSQIPSDLNTLSYPRELDRAGIRELERMYADAARRAEAAGFDIVYVYGAHSFLPLQFLSSFYNKRTDEYGGPLENRARFWLETLELVREAVGDSCAIAVRLAVDARGPHGVRLEEGLEFVRLADHLVDLWDVNIGSITDRSADIAPSRCDDQAWQLPWTGRVREATAKPIVGVGRLTDPFRMVEIVESGVWDLIGAARPSISDPFLPVKIEEGRLDDIRECIGCNVCLARALDHHQIARTQNATAGEEYRRGWHPERFDRAANADSDVLVVGAGPAGLECALVLAKRGLRRVHLVDAAAEPGGSLRWITQLPGLGLWRRVVDYRTHQLEKLANAELVPHTRLDADAVREYGAEIVVVATGARWAADGLNPLTHDTIPGADRPHVLTPERVVAGEEPAGTRVLVYDCEGYFVGVGVAELLAARGHSVLYATPLALVGPFLDHTEEGIPVRQRLADLEVTTAVETELVSIGADACSLRSFGREREVEADAVVLVTARVSDDALFRALRDDCGPVDAVYAIGDCVAPRLIADCVFDGHRLAREIDTADPRRPLPYLRERRLLADAPAPLPASR